MSLQTEFALFDNPNIDILRSRSEDQWFDRKGIKIEATKLATHLIGFANADGGRIALGIVNGEIEGINAFPNQLNENYFRRYSKALKVENVGRSN